MPFDLPLLKDAPVAGKRVLLRLNLDVPVANGRVEDTYRLDSVHETLTFLKTRGAKTLIIGHIGRGPEETLRPVFEYMHKSFSATFVKTLEEAKRSMATLKEGGFVMLENLRSFSGETKNDPAFAASLASLVDLYINDAFAVSHREHASIVGVPRLLPSFVGFLLASEVLHLSRAFSPEHPMLVILGGAKFETKTPLIEKFLGIADDLYVCGALANDIYKARGYETGNSLISNCTLSRALLANPKLHVPVDVIVRRLYGSVAKRANVVENGEKIVDAGENALDDMREFIQKAKFVLWNGPLGEYEAGFDQGTIAIAQMLAECDAETVIGGGDSLAVVSRLGLRERFSFVSTGGGAMLEFLANETLPGIEALIVKH